MAHLVASHGSRKNFLTSINVYKWNFPCVSLEFCCSVCFQRYPGYPKNLDLNPTCTREQNHQWPSAAVGWHCLHTPSLCVWLQSHAETPVKSGKSLMKPCDASWVITMFCNALWANHMYYANMSLKKVLISDDDERWWWVIVMSDDEWDLKKTKLLWLWLLDTEKKEFQDPKAVFTCVFRWVTSQTKTQ